MSGIRWDNKLDYIFPQHFSIINYPPGAVVKTFGSEKEALEWATRPGATFEHVWIKKKSSKSKME